MVIRVAVGRGSDDYGRKLLYEPHVTDPPVAFWHYARRCRRDDTKYATLEVAGWTVEFHEYRNSHVCSRWLVISREDDRRWLNHRTAVLRIPRPDIGATLVLKTSRGKASMELRMGDLSAELWDKYAIREVKVWKRTNDLLYRYFQDDGRLRYIDAIFTDGKAHMVYGGKWSRLDAVEIKNARWAAVLSANETNGRGLSLTVYTTLNHVELEKRLDEFVAEHGVKSFFQGQLRGFAVYSEEDY